MLDLTLEENEKKILRICDMACPQENNIVTKRDKRERSRDGSRSNQENREKSTRYILYFIAVAIGVLGGSIKEKFMKSRKYSSKTI